MVDERASRQGYRKAGQACRSRSSSHSQLKHRIVLRALLGLFGIESEAVASEPEAAPLTGAGCPLCGTPNSLLQRHAVVFCAADGCGFRLDTTGDALSVSSLSAKAFGVLAAHNSVCSAAPSVYERHRVLFLECAECLTCEVLA